MQVDRQKKLEGLTKALSDLSSFINVVKAGTYPGRSVEDAAKLLKFLQDNYKALEKQYTALTEEIRKEIETQDSIESKE